MNNVQTIPFVDALNRLQALLGEEIRVHINFRAAFGGCALEGELTRVHTFPPDHAAVDVLLDERQAFTLDPIDTEVFLAGDEVSQTWWLEFHAGSAVVVTVERASPGDS